MAEVKSKLKDKLRGWNIEEITLDSAIQSLNKVNKELSQILKTWTPNSSYKFFRARYYYGKKIMLNGRVQLPLKDGTTVDISDALVPTELKQELSYSSLPLGIILNNSVEVFSELSDESVSLALFEPGVPLGLLETLESPHSYCFRKVWNATAGSRSAFMVPKISDKAQHSKIQRTIGCEINAPQSHNDHFEVFVEIMTRTGDQQKWYVDILFLSKKWFVSDYKNFHWISFHNFLQKYLLLYTGFSRNKVTFDLTWHQFLKVLNQKKKRVNLPIFELMKNLVISALGVTPSYSVANDNSRGPMDILQKIYLEIYDLQYAPTIMVPRHFGFNEQEIPAYFSPKYKNAFETNPKNKLSESLISDLYQLNSVLRDFVELVKARKLKVEDTLVESIIKATDFEFYHISPKGYSNISDTKLLPISDPWLVKQINNNKKLPFPYTSNYFRSCVQMRQKNNINIDKTVNVVN